MKLAFYACFADVWNLKYNFDFAVFQVPINNKETRNLGNVSAKKRFDYAHKHFFTLLHYLKNLSFNLRAGNL